MRKPQSPVHTTPRCFEILTQNVPGKKNTLLKLNGYYAAVIGEPIRVYCPPKISKYILNIVPTYTNTFYLAASYTISQSYTYRIPF